eukprot:SAG31_NODE_13304_length_878_cov_1.410783_1_plen_120_part_10
MSAGRAPAFAEIYSDPPLAKTYGFDGEYADNKLCPTHSARSCPRSPRSAAIAKGILTGNATLVESAMHGPGSVDDMTARLFRATSVQFISSYFPGLPMAASWLPGTDAFHNTTLNCSRGA